MAVIERLGAEDQARHKPNQIGLERAVKPLPQIDLRELCRTLWRRRMTTTAIVILGIAAAVIYALTATPMFRAEALVVIETRDLNIVDIDDVVSRLTGNEEEISSEVEILGSRRLADKAISETSLDTLAEFNKYLRRGPIVQGQEWLVNFAAAVANKLGVNAPAGPVPTEPPINGGKTITNVIATPTQIRTHVIDSYLDALDVRQIGRSQVIALGFVSKDPALAASIVNTLADEYILDQLESKFSAARLASEWLSGRLSELRVEVEETEQRISEYRADKGLLKGTQASIIVEQLSALTAQRAIAQGELAKAESRGSLVQRLAAEKDGSGLLEVISSPVIQRQKTEETALLRRLAEIETQYGPRHPITLNIAAELERVSARIDQEVAIIQRSITSETESERARVRSLDDEIRTLRAQIESQEEEEIGLRALEREAEATQVLFATFLERYKETNEQEGLAQPDARVIQYSDVPVEASWPKKGLIVGGAGIVSLLLGIGLALVAEVLDRRVLSPEKLELEMGLPAIGLIPAVGNRRSPPHDFAIDKPSSAYAETLRSVHTSIFSDPRLKPKSLLVASSAPAEGKSTLAVSLARLVSGRGHTVVILDGDMRRPSVHRLVGRRNNKGLVEYLVDEVDLEEVIQDDPKSGAKFVSPGRWHTDSVELFRSERMKTLLKQLGSKFDLVVIDSPPILSLSDARVLAGLVDVTILAVRWRTTRHELVQQSVRLLSESGARIGGLVITRVNMRRFNRYNYGNASYFGKYKQYYVDA